MSDLEDDFIGVFNKESKRPKGRARRALESRSVVSPAMRRQMRSQETKNTQMNLKVTESFKARVTRYAMAHGMSVVETMELAFDTLAGSSGE